MFSFCALWSQMHHGCLGGLADLSPRGAHVPAYLERSWHRCPLFDGRGGPRAPPGSGSRSDASSRRTNHLSKIRKTVKSMLISTIADKTDTPVAAPYVRSLQTPTRR